MTNAQISTTETEISIRGVATRVPSLHLGNREITVTKGWLKVASVRDEDYVQGESVADPSEMIANLKKTKLPVDVFTFSQRLPDLSANYQFPVWWDNVAAITMSSYDDWWSSLSQETRRNVRLAAKRGVVVTAVPFTDALVQGISEIYNETPIRQGRRFWHYGKTFDEVKRDNSSFTERSEFIAAYVGNELVGFIKMVYVDRIASIMQILCKNSHQDKKCMNALIAKAVEICHKKGASHLIYCKYIYHKNQHEALTEFKRRNGFQKISIPRYYVPLSLLGRFAVRMRLHLPVSELLPERLVTVLLRWRASYFTRRYCAGLDCR